MSYCWLIHDVEGNIVELLYNIETSLAILALQRPNCLQEFISPAEKNICVPEKVGVTESKAQHSSHARVLFAISLIDDVHGMINFRRENIGSLIIDGTVRVPKPYITFCAE